jgi:hypothetical protein
MLAYVHADLGLIAWLVVLLFVVGAGYLAYLGNIVGCVLLLIVAVVAAALLT